MSGTPYQAWRSGGAHTAVGDLRVFESVHSPQLNNTRNVVVHLPPSYALSPTRRYPVFYMQDGQNLFDARTSFIGQEWQVDEAMQALALEDLEAIVVGVWNTDQRMAEYTPFSIWWQGRGNVYIDFLTNTLKPLIDDTFRTSPKSQATAIIGSSLGGLIATHAFFAKPDVFGLCAALSPAYWPGAGEIYKIVERAPLNPGRMYLDNGTREPSARRMNDLLISKGYVTGQNLMFIEEPEGQHNEAAWARRFPGSTRFLLQS